MADGDLRSLIKGLEASGNLKRVSAEVDKDWEISCITRQVMMLPQKERYALLFENVKGYSSPVAVGVVGGSRQLYARALGCEIGEVHERWISAINGPLRPVEKDWGPCKEKVMMGPEIDLNAFPIPIWTPGKDPGPYITAGCVITKDPETGGRNIGVYRVQLKGKAKLGIQIISAKHIGIQHAKYEAMGSPMEVVIAIGPEPAVQMTAVARIPYGLDEVAVAGALQGEPVEMVKCETVDLHVPASSEIVIEGVIPPQLREMEGPFGEFAGFMGPAWMHPVINVTAVTHRADPIYQAFIEQKPPSEGSCLKDIALEVVILRALRSIGIPGVIGVNVTEMGAQYHLVVAIRKLFPGHVKALMQGCWAAYPVGCKQIVVVEEDCDIYDAADVEWHVATRVQPDRDILIIKDCTGHPLDPSGGKDRQEWGAKMGIDATRKHRYPEVALPPKELLDKVKANWRRYGLPGLGK